MFDFQDMLKQYEQEITVIEKEDGYFCEDTGQWVDGDEEEVTEYCPVLTLTDDDLRMDEGGAYKAEDRKLYIHRQLDENKPVKIDGKEFKVMDVRDYSFYANGLRVYYVRRVDAND